MEDELPASISRESLRVLLVVADGSEFLEIADVITLQRDDVVGQLGRFSVERIFRDD